MGDFEEREQNEATITHEEWVVACAAWCNVPPEKIAAETMPEGSRAAWQRVYKAVANRMDAECLDLLKSARGCVAWVASDITLSNHLAYNDLLNRIDRALAAEEQGDG